LPAREPVRDDGKGRARLHFHKVASHQWWGGTKSLSFLCNYEKKRGRSLYFKPPRRKRRSGECLDLTVPEN